MRQTSCRLQTSCGSGLKQPSVAASPAWLVSIIPSQLHIMLCLENAMKAGSHVGMTQVCSNIAWLYEEYGCVLCPCA